MGMMDLLLGRKSAPGGKTRPSKTGHSTQFGPSQATQGAGSVHSVRKDMLRVALRDTVMRNGIPPNWLSAEMLRTNSKGEVGMHVRFLLRHWDPRLMLHGPALEQDFTQRLLLLDPQAGGWLAGFSWQFALEDRGICPPLPHPNEWTAPPPRHARTEPMPLATGQGDVIEGPVVIPRPQAEVRADLERLLAARDEDIKRNGGTPDQFAPTRPATL